MNLLAYVNACLLAGALAAAPALVHAQRGDPAKPAAKPAKPAASAQLDRGRYLVKIAGCNDCHTANYAASGGKVAEKEWLTGDTLGWRGPWGTTYASNLRLYMQRMNEDKWVETAKTLKTRPPMPWFVLHDMSTSDLRALYRYVRSLGPAGQEAPAFLPPDKEPKPPFVQFPAPPK
jgi:mono/diheme cytochrome c family protein